MSLSTGVNFEKVLKFLSICNAIEWELESKIPSESTLDQIPPHVADEFGADEDSSQKVCDWPVFDKEKGLVKIYFSCCCEEGIVLILSVKTIYPDSLINTILEILECKAA